MARYELIIERRQPTCGGRAPTASEVRIVETVDPMAYVQGQDSYRALARTYGVAYNQICRRGKAEGWPAQRKEHQTSARESQPDAMARLKNASDSLDEQLLDLLEKPNKPLDSKSVGELSRALKTAIDIKRELYPVEAGEVTVILEGVEALAE